MITNKRSFLEEKISYIMVFVNDILTENFQSIKTMIEQDFCESGILLKSINKGKDFCIDLNKKVWLMGESNTLDFFHKATKIVSENCEKNFGYIESTNLVFPTYYSLVTIVVPFSESDRHNKIQIVAHSKDVIDWENILLQITYGKENTSQEKILGIVKDWHQEAVDKGFEGEFLQNKENKIKDSGKKIEFYVSSEKPVLYPFLELYLRLRSGLDKFERPKSLYFK